jgi:hypothetical protein
VSWLESCSDIFDAFVLKFNCFSVLALFITSAQHVRVDYLPFSSDYKLINIVVYRMRWHPLDIEVRLSEFPVIFFFVHSMARNIHAVVNLVHAVELIILIIVFVPYSIKFKPFTLEQSDSGFIKSLGRYVARHWGLPIVQVGDVVKPELQIMKI